MGSTGSGFGALLEDARAPHSFQHRDDTTAIHNDLRNRREDVDADTEARDDEKERFCQHWGMLATSSNEMVDPRRGELRLEA